MEKDKLEAGLEYWLDEDKNDSGIYIGTSESEILFKRTSGSYYSAEEDGTVGFSDLSDDDFFLVSKNPID